MTELFEPDPQTGIESGIEIAAAPSRPALPEPALARWQPLRLGLVELFHYDSEEFWFHDGHLLLRGNNGTGKSKVLSLTLPFLFDAQLKSSRIEPDGDSGKKMAWNLLLGRHERRMGYAWIEFGRVDAEGKAHYLTLGCGLSAAAARTQVDSWYFVLEESANGQHQQPRQHRIGRDLWLTSEQRVVLTKERLRERLAGCGQVFDTAVSYRRAVDERLFRLGPTRYAALMDTLIQLRQPQLSKKPDEGSLSAALTEALPPLASDLLTDVADALNQLEEFRRELEEYEALAKAVGQFNRRYRVYAATQARRQARSLRSAQSGFDGASRALNDARTALQAAQADEGVCKDALDAAERAVQDSRTRLETLQADPLMQDANRLEQAGGDAQARQRDAEDAVKARGEAQARSQRESIALRERAARAAQAEHTLAEARLQAESVASAAGIAESFALNPLAAADAPALAELDALAFDTARHDLRALLAQRREQLALLRRRCAELEQVEQQERRLRQQRDERSDALEEAAARREQADGAVDQQGRSLLDVWQGHVDGLQQLVAAPRLWTEALQALADWVSTLQGDNPARLALQAAQAQASQRLAERQAELARLQRELQAEQQALTEERARLAQGVDAVPPAPPTRAPGTREARAGAPLWQLVEFRAHVDAAERAGLEAALQAAALLDAWVTPDGSLTTAAGAPLHDTQVLRRPARQASLAQWLACADSGAAPVLPAVVNALLEGIACGMQEPADAETWVSPDGRFRVGALAGAWHKPAAAFIGFAARAAARERRMAEIDQRAQQLAQVEHTLRAQTEQHDLQRQQAANEWRDAPSDDALRAAHAQAAAAEREVQTARTRLAQAETPLREAVQQLQAARERLNTDAQDLRLPDNVPALQGIEHALVELGEALQAVSQAAAEWRLCVPELAQQRQREAEAAQDALLREQQLTDRRKEADAALMRLETLRASVGAQVDELKQRLTEARLATREGEVRLKARSDTLRIALENRARAEQRAQDGEATLLERVALRLHAVARLQGFAATGLLAAALPDTEPPDLRSAWTIDPALSLARSVEQALIATPDDDDTWTRVQAQVSQDYSELGRTLTALGQQAQAETNDYGLVVSVMYRNQPQQPDALAQQLAREITERRELLTAGERKVLENHLQAEIAAAVQKLLQEAERQVVAINKELHKRPTSTGVRFRLQWQPLPEGAEGAPVGLEAARKRLLHTSTDLWSAEDRSVVGAMLQQRIAAERARADVATTTSGDVRGGGAGNSGGGSLFEQLARALDYRQWHRFRVQRWQDGQWRPLSGPASSGERALGLTVPLFAAVSSFYSQGAYALAPRLVLLDEAFAGIDDAARAHCMGLIREFDLDFVITSEREWACYAELPGVAICQLQRREGVDAVHVSRWTWDGKARRREADPDRRFF